IKGEGIRSFIIWIFALIIIRSLSLHRGFLHRCALVLFSIGLIVLPYLVVKGPGLGGMRERLAVDSTVMGYLSNSNDLGTWFGFYCLYFTIVGIETKHNGVRIVSILIAVGCLYIVGLTVSRGALLATAIGITIACRRLLRGGFVPLLLFITLIGTAYTF